MLGRQRNGKISSLNSFGGVGNSIPLHNPPEIDYLKVDRSTSFNNAWSPIIDSVISKFTAPSTTVPPSSSSSQLAVDAANQFSFTSYFPFGFSGSLAPDKNATLPINQTENATLPINQTGNATLPINQTGNATLPINQTGNATLAINQTGNATLPINRTENVTLPINRTENAALPINRTENVTLPINRTENATLPINRTGNATMPINQTENVTLPINQTFSSYYNTSDTQLIAKPGTSAVERFKDYGREENDDDDDEVELTLRGLISGMVPQPVHDILAYADPRNFPRVMKAGSALMPHVTRAGYELMDTVSNMPSQYLHSLQDAQQASVKIGQMASDSASKGLQAVGQATDAVSEAVSEAVSRPILDGLIHLKEEYKLHLDQAVANSFDALSGSRYENASNYLNIGPMQAAKIIENSFLHGTRAEYPIYEPPKDMEIIEEQAEQSQLPTTRPDYLAQKLINEGHPRF